MTVTATVPRGTLEQLPLESIDVGPNVRAKVDDLEDLTASVRELGVLEPVQVEPAGDRYLLIFGQRRLAAAREAGLTTIPALVVDRKANLGRRLTEQLVENIQRSDLNPLDEARALQQLIDGPPARTQADVAKLIGRSAPYVSNALRLLETAPKVQELVATGALTASHAKALAALPKKDQQELAENAVKYKQSAHDLERNIGYRVQSWKSDAERKEAAKKKVPGVAKRLVKLLGANEVPKDAPLVLSMYDVDEAAVRKLLVDAGWTGAKKSASGIYGYDPADLECDCQAYRHETYPAPAHFKRVCISRAHVDAYQAKQRASQQQSQRDLAAKRERVAAFIRAGVGRLEATTAKLLLAALAGRELVQLVEAKHDDDPWPLLERESDGDVKKAIAEAIAEDLTEDRGWNRIESPALHKFVNELAGPTPKAAKARAPKRFVATDDPAAPIAPAP